MNVRSNEVGEHAALFRMLPQVHEVLSRASLVALEERYPRTLVADAVRDALSAMRSEIIAGKHVESSLRERLDGLQADVERQIQRITRPSLKAVINATGVVLQTNLGRAPLPASAIQRVAEVASGYCNLETDLESGARGKRDHHAESLILAVLRSRLGAVRPLRALVVNNCAAACFLALNTLADGGEVIVSRGELVEIGGGFRVPDILRKSGADLREVGTTNRTRIADYANAITDKTRLILRVHRSNFRIDGFTEQPSLRELRDLGRQHGIPVFEDQGTGSLIDLDQLGLADESSLLRSVTSGIDLVAASGDKLLGGPQCGLLVGAPEVMDRLRANPLFRALRVDKMTYAALQATLLEYLAGDEQNVPAIALLRAPAGSLRERCEAVVHSLAGCPAELDVVLTEGAAGGGTTPGGTLPGFAIGIRPHGSTETALAARLRSMEPAVLARTQDGRVLLDFRAVFPGQDAALTRAVLAALASFDQQGA